MPNLAKAVKHLVFIGVYFFMTSPKDKKRSSQRVSLDILSNLPGNLIDEILIRLPLQDAVRTSILSKKWRYNWCKLPELTLNEQAYRTSEKPILLATTFTNIVNHLLTLHSGPITKFTLNFDPYLIPCPTFDNLIYFLSRNGIQHLVLRLPWGIEPYKLPSSFFSCLQLRHLTLQNCLIELLPPAFKGFHSISLFWKKFLLCIIVFLWRKDTDITKFFKSFSVVQHLKLDDGSLKLFAAGPGGVPTRLTFDLISVESLHLSDIFLDALDVVSCALCLIRSFPYLQYMEIEVGDCCEDYIPALECLEVEGFSDVTFSRLREVKLIGDLAIEPGIQLVKLLLAKSPVLVKMLIETWINDDTAEQLIQSLGKTYGLDVVLAEFPRASPNAKVVYNVEYDHHLDYLL
ncbi:PREDICTED: F-box/LRR-repeat protein At4g14103-like [Nicotiana attenuata]|uniref:F-box/LRR-repeat protein At4g14103-like n=1 Tax=Nicotiana attenuata TaxID=49451 RepID=UPI000904EEA4|nr:PREDICTED: F-box/LRR-repeat protein At4g14103-like [Nicotiana attenuata]